MYWLQHTDVHFVPSRIIVQTVHAENSTMCTFFKELPKLDHPADQYNPASGLIVSSYKLPFKKGACIKLRAL